MGKRRRRRVDPTDELRWEQLELLCIWDEQVEYERIRPLVLFGQPELSEPGRYEERTRLGAGFSGSVLIAGGGFGFRCAVGLGAMSGPATLWAPTSSY